jgi:hypothetical protein
MILVLLWLTVSTSFIFNAQKQIPNQTKQQTIPANSQQEEEAANPMAGTTEEKIPGTANTLSEFLRETGLLKHLLQKNTKYYWHIKFALYKAFHGELLVPPPNC